MKKIFLFLILLFLTKSYCQSLNPIVDSLFYAKKNSLKIINPNLGVSIGILYQGKTYYYNFGNKNREENNPINENSVFEIGSNTKIFTALLLANELVKNKIKQSDYIDTYLPINSLNDSISNKIKITDLVSHSSGLPTLHGDKYDDENNKIDSVQPYRNIDNAYLLNILKKTNQLEKYHQYNYSNYNWGLLGIILSKLNNNSFENLIDKNILIPLNLSNTSSKTIETKNVAGRYDSDGNKTDYVILNDLNPAGILKSNSVDMLTFLKNEIYSEKSILKKSILKSQELLFTNEDLSMAFGWHIFNEKGNQIYLNQGDTSGNSSLLAFDKKNKIGIAILLNQQDHNLTGGIFDYLYNQILKLN